MAQHSKQQKILEVAGDMFMRSGFSAVSMDAIAEAVPVSKPTLYNHFKDKKALFEAVMGCRCQGLFDALEDMIQKGAGVKEALTAIASQFLVRVLSEEALRIHRLIIAESANFAELGAFFYNAGPAKAQAFISRYLRDVHNNGQLHIPEPDRSAALFLSMLKGSTHMQFMLGIKTSLSEDERKAIVEHAVGVFMRGHGS